MTKIRTLDQLAAERAQWRREGKTVVWTNGCFDIVHAGHVRALQAAAALGDVLIVGLNSDASVRALKGPTRPVVCQQDRATMLAALECVSRVLIFDALRCDNELRALAPDVWTKSGDYTEESLDQGELAALKAGGGRVQFTPLVPGLSTSILIEKIRGLK